jgi:molybdopterin-guanine dinucleotide biosynthesis protein A
MGRDKSRLRLGTLTMLRRVQETAAATGLAVRVIRRDLVARCGPLGGIYTGLKTAKAEKVLFLACDMPFLTPEILQELEMASSQNNNQAVFLRAKGSLGFPIVLPRMALDSVASQINRSRYSLHQLAKALRAQVIRIPTKWEPSFENINTLRDLDMAKKRLLLARGTSDACQSNQT